MIEQLGTALRFFAFFTATKQGVTGLTVTVDVYEPGGALVVTAAAAVELGGGLYTYTLASGSVITEGGYAAMFKTADGSVDMQHVPSLWTVGVAGVEQLDATVSSRNATAPDSAATIAAAVWATGTRSLTTFGTLVADIWASVSRTLTSAAPPTAAANATAVRTELATELARIDVATSTRNATAPDSAATIAAAVWAAGTRSLTTFGTLVADIWASVSRTLTSAAPPSAAANATAVRTELTAELARIDVAISTRNATAPDSAATIAAAVWAAGTRSLTTFGTLVADIWASVSRTLTSGAAPSAAAIADAVWDEATVDHATAGSTGAAIVAAGAAGDPWSATVPGAYDEGTAGFLMGRLAAVDGDGPVTVIPAAPADESLCTVFGYFEHPGNAPAANVEVIFTLVSPDLTKSERIVVGRQIKARTNAAGYLEQTLQRNDLLEPAGSTYRVSCPSLNLSNREITLDAETFDLMTLV